MKIKLFPMKIWVHDSVREEITFVRKWGKNLNEYDKGGGVEIKKEGGGIIIIIGHTNILAFNICKSNY